MNHGLLALPHPDRRLLAFIPHDPQTAGCRIELTNREPAPR